MYIISDSSVSPLVCTVLLWAGRNYEVRQSVFLKNCKTHLQTIQLIHRSTAAAPRYLSHISLFLTRKSSPVHDLSITTENSVVSSGWTARNLGVILDDQPSKIAMTAHSCIFMLRNIRKALVILHRDQILAGVPACAIRPLIQNAAVRLVFNLLKSSHTTPPHPALATGGCSISFNTDSLSWCKCARSHPTSRTWSNYTPQSVHYGLITACCPGSMMVEKALHWHCDSRNSADLQLQTENSLVQTEKDLFCFLSLILTVLKHLKFDVFTSL